MKPIAPLVVLMLVAAGAVAAGDGPVLDTVAAQLEARAERPPQPASAETFDRRGIPQGQLIFWMDGPDNAECVRGFPDVTGDGIPEVVVGFDESGVDNVFCLDGSSSGAATTVWSFQTNGGLSGGSPYDDDSLVPASDADGNTSPNLLVGTAWGGRTAFSLDGDAGAVNWKFDTYLEPESGWIYSLAEMSDVSGDGVPDVAFGAGSDSNTIFMVDGSTQVGQAVKLWSYMAPDGIAGVRNIGDLNGDGDDDLVVAVTDNGQRLLFMSGDPPTAGGQVLDTYLSGATTVWTEVLPDVTGDGINEALAAVWVSDGSAIRCVNGATGSEVWRSTTVDELGMQANVLGDVNGNGVPDVVAASWENAVSVLDGADGTEIWKTSVGTLNGGDVWTARGIGDVTGDGVDDVVAGSFDGHVYAMDGTDGTILWSYDTGNRVFSVAPVGDLTGDGYPEVVAGTQDTTSLRLVYVLDGASHIVFSDGFEDGDTTAWSTAVP